MIKVALAAKQIYLNENESFSYINIEENPQN